MRALARIVTRFLAGIGVFLEILVLFLAGFSTLALWDLGAPLRFMIPFVGAALVLQLCLRNSRGWQLVAVAFLILLPPYWWLACPAAHAQASAASVGGKILDHLKVGDVDGASAFFGDTAFAQAFREEVDRHSMLGLRQWTLVDAMQVWREQGSAEFMVGCADGVTRNVDVEVWSRYFRPPAAYNFCVLER